MVWHLVGITQVEILNALSNGVTAYNCKQDNKKDE